MKQLEALEEKTFNLQTREHPLCTLEQHPLCGGIQLYNNLPIEVKIHCVEMLKIDFNEWFKKE